MGFSIDGTTGRSLSDYVNHTDGDGQNATFRYIGTGAERKIGAFATQDIGSAEILANYDKFVAPVSLQLGH